MSDPQTGLLARLTDEQVLDMLGPDWSKMTARQREAYGPPGSGASDATYPRLAAWLRERATARETTRAESDLMRRYQAARDRIRRDRAVST
jgi:hypothetical protein